MRARGSGLLVHVSSIGGRLIWPFYGVYCASRHALEALAEAYRYELSPLGIDSVLVQPGPYPTNLMRARRAPTDHERVVAYGEVAETGAAFIAGVEQMLASDEAPDPQDVADAIAGLVDTPPGRRPLRTVVGPGVGTAEINDATAPYARDALDAFGLGHLAAIPAASPSPVL